jgi:hypothetical protein
MFRKLKKIIGEFILILIFIEIILFIPELILIEYFCLKEIQLNKITITSNGYTYYTNNYKDENNCILFDIFVL